MDNFTSYKCQKIYYVYLFTYKIDIYIFLEENCAWTHLVNDIHIMMELMILSNCVVLTVMVTQSTLFI